MRFVFACAVFFGFYLLANYYNSFILKKYILQQDEQKDKKIKKVNLVYFQLANFVYYLILLVGLSFSFSIIGISNTAILTVLATFGLSITLAMKDSLSNLVSGIILSMRQTYQIGDYIVIVSNGRPNIKGYVKEYDLLDTTLLDDNGQLVTVPNDIIFGNIIINSSSSQ
jgi:small-conductance mechanosensitive channel